MDQLGFVLKRVWQIERHKFRKNGLMCTLIGCFLLYVYFYQFPILAKRYWPEHIENKKLFQIVAVISLFWFFQTIWGMILYLPGYLGMDIYKKYEISPGLKKPWERPDWPEVKKRTIKSTLITYFILGPIWFTLGGMFGKMRWDGFPTHLELLRDFLIILFADDLALCFAHRMFHAPMLYKYHKVHHEYDSVYSFMAQYTHPIDQIFGFFIPGSMAVMFMNLHIFTFLFWVILKLYNTTEGHSGYAFPWSPTRLIPLNYDASYHEFHHSKNIGNFAGTVYLWELFTGNNKVFFDQILANDNAKKKE